MYQMSKVNNSKNWIKGHIKDPFVIQAQKDGYRSRAAYKLIEIDKKYKIIKSGITAVDLGAAPGGWSQVLTKKIGLKGKVVGIDLLEVAPIKGIDFIQGDFMREEILIEMVDKLENNPVDLVISDMAPNLTGSKAVDQPASIYLVELAVDLACQVMKPEGVFVAKIFQGEGFDEFVRHVRTLFNTVSMRKPDASRAKSREVYMVAKGLKA